MLFEGRLNCYKEVVPLGDYHSGNKMGITQQIVSKLTPIVQLVQRNKLIYFKQCILKKKSTSYSQVINRTTHN